MSAGVDVSRNGGDVAFRTAFSDEYDLVQVFQGLTSTVYANHPVDFRLAALQHKGHPDIWHMDQVLAFCTDECSPMVINGEDIGGNHGHPCGVQLTAPGHGLTVADVGSLWRDESGLRWTLLRAAADKLLLLSDNTGISEVDYAFADRVDGALHPLDEHLQGREVRPAGQRGGVQLVPAIRHMQREVWVSRDGRWQLLDGDAEGCDGAEIREVYEIVNPATVAAALRAARPAGGYVTQPSLAVGTAMFRHQMTYRIAPDGTVLCDFDHQLLQPVRMPWYLGVMHQAKCDLYGGGLWRVIPKLRPFTAKGYTLDFSRPCLTTADTLPDYVPLTPDTWADPTSPPDRQLDFIRRADGSDAVGFASGFLPVYDGAPLRRAENITDAGTLVKSCKTYPTFAGGMGCKRSFPRLRGVAYKKYFRPEQGASVYTVPYGADTYLYMDLYTAAPRRVRYEKSPLQTPELLEATASVQVTGDEITAQGATGYAVFCLHGPVEKG